MLELPKEPQIRAVFKRNNTVREILSEMSSKTSSTLEIEHIHITGNADGYHVVGLVSSNKDEIGAFIEADISDELYVSNVTGEMEFPQSVVMFEFNEDTLLQSEITL